MPESALILGAGVFGLTAAVTLAKRGHRVSVIDPGPIPHPHAASNDISKAIRAEYGPDRLYTRLADDAIDGWLAWNNQFPQRVYEPTGVLILAGSEMTRGGFEHDSYHLALRRGRSPQRLQGDELTARFPAFAAQRYPDGFYHARGGLTYAGRTIEAIDVAVEVCRDLYDRQRYREALALLDAIARDLGGKAVPDAEKAAAIRAEALSALEIFCLLQ